LNLPSCLVSASQVQRIQAVPSYLVKHRDLQKTWLGKKHPAVIKVVERVNSQIATKSLNWPEQPLWNVYRGHLGTSEREWSEPRVIHKQNLSPCTLRMQ
jgi:hypothetical protein